MVLALRPEADTTHEAARRPVAGRGPADNGPADRLAAFLSARLDGRTLRLTGCRRLDGGAVQENWLVSLHCGAGDTADSRDYVIRTLPKTALPDSATPEQEFAVLALVHGRGVRTPKPLWLCSDPAVIGAAFFVMESLPGTANGHILTGSATITAKDRQSLAYELGVELAKIHAITPPVEGLSLPGDPRRPDAPAAIADCRSHLDQLGAARPALEWGLRWCEENLPVSRAPVLLHGDYRTGNYLAAEGRLTGILDWEFARWGDPMSDIGWFCARCWRFGRHDLEAGGIAPREAFYEGYRASGGRIDPDAVRFWEVMAHIRWAVIALQQGRRFFEGGEESLDLGLTGRIRPHQLAHQILKMTPPERWPPERQDANEEPSHG